MKSPMIILRNYITDKDNYTDLMVLRSNAGYYVGTIYNNPVGFQEPGSRDSGYFETKEQAELELKAIIAGTSSTRLSP